MFKRACGIAGPVAAAIVLLIFVTGTAEAAWEDPVKGELTPVKNINWSEINPPKPEYVMPGWLEEKVKEFVATEFEKDIDEVNILWAYNYSEPYYREDIGITLLGIFVCTNFSHVHYDIETGEMRLIYQYIKPKISIEEATNKIMKGLLEIGLIKESDTLYEARYGKKINQLKITLNYVQKDDYNFYPEYTSSFYFMKSNDENGALYNFWSVTIDPDTGQIKNIENHKNVTFRKIKTKEDVEGILEKNNIIAVDFYITYYVYSESVPEWRIVANHEFGHFNESGSLTLTTDKMPNIGQKIYYIIVGRNQNPAFQEYGSVIKEFAYNGIFEPPPKNYTDIYDVYVMDTPERQLDVLYLSDDGNFIDRGTGGPLSGSGGYVETNLGHEKIEDIQFSWILIISVVVAVVIIMATWKRYK
jgi:hypothetical protein